MVLNLSMGAGAAAEFCLMYPTRRRFTDHDSNEVCVGVMILSPQATYADRTSTEDSNIFESEAVENAGRIHFRNRTVARSGLIQNGKKTWKRFSAETLSARV